MGSTETVWNKVQSAKVFTKLDAKKGFVIDTTS